MIKEKILEKGFTVAGIFAASISLLILIFLTIFAFPLFKPTTLRLILNTHWQPLMDQYGIIPMLLTSMALALGAVFLALPAGLGISCLLTGLAPKKVRSIGIMLVRFMTSIPTVLYGFISIIIFIPFVRNVFQFGSGFCLLSAMIVLSVLILPTTILIISSSFSNVPKKYLEGAMALGFTPTQQYWHLIIPYCKPAISNAFLLSFGRAIGDTMIALMLAGNAPQMPNHLLRSVRSLTSHIALVMNADLQSVSFKSIFASGLLLFIIIITINLVSTTLLWKFKNDHS